MTSQPRPGPQGVVALADISPSISRRGRAPAREKNTFSTMVEFAARQERSEMEPGDVITGQPGALGAGALAAGAMTSGHAPASLLVRAAVRTRSPRRRAPRTIDGPAFNPRPACHQVGTGTAERPAGCNRFFARKSRPSRRAGNRPSAAWKPPPQGGERAANIIWRATSIPNSAKNGRRGFMSEPAAGGRIGPARRGRRGGSARTTAIKGMAADGRQRPGVSLRCVRHHDLRRIRGADDGSGPLAFAAGATGGPGRAVERIYCWGPRKKPAKNCAAA